MEAVLAPISAPVLYLCITSLSHGNTTLPFLYSTTVAQVDTDKENNRGWAPLLVSLN